MAQSDMHRQRRGRNYALGAFLLVRARSRDSLAGITRNQLNLHLRHPDLVRVTAPSDKAKSSFANGSFRCDLEGMQTSPQFRNDYELNQANFALHTRDNARVDASLRELNKVLVDVLGRPGETTAP